MPMITPKTKRTLMLIITLTFLPAGAFAIAYPTDPPDAVATQDEVNNYVSLSEGRITAIEKKLIDLRAQMDTLTTDNDRFQKLKKAVHDASKDTDKAREHLRDLRTASSVEKRNKLRDKITDKITDAEKQINVLAE